MRRIRRTRAGRLFHSRIFKLDLTITSLYETEFALPPIINILPRAFSTSERHFASSGISIIALEFGDIASEPKLDSTYHIAFAGQHLG
jgi:hypothetical protein